MWKKSKKQYWEQMGKESEPRSHVLNGSEGNYILVKETRENMVAVITVRDEEGLN